MILIWYCLSHYHNIFIEEKKVKKGRETFLYDRLGKVLLPVSEVLNLQRNTPTFSMNVHTAAFIIGTLYATDQEEKKIRYSVTCDDYLDDQQEIGFDAIP